MRIAYVLNRLRWEDDRCLHVAFLYDIAWNVNQTCQHESNHYYPYWTCSTLGGSWNALLRARQQKCCRRPTTQHTPAEHLGAYCRQDLCHWVRTAPQPS